MTDFYRNNYPAPAIPPEKMWATFLHPQELAAGYTFRDHAKYMYDNEWIDEECLQHLFRKSAGKNASKGEVHAATELARDYIHSGHTRRTIRDPPDQSTWRTG